MASNKNIKGITIEINATTTKLENALRDVTTNLNKTQKELREVDKMLKFDPSNTELLAQKQQLLQKQLTESKNRLRELLQAQQQVEEQFQRGEIGEEQYRAFKREVEKAKKEVQDCQKELMNFNRTDINDVTDDMEDLGDNAEKSQNQVDGLYDKLMNLGKTLVTLDAIKKALEYTLDYIDQDVNLDVTMDLDEESKKNVYDSLHTLEAYSIDSEEALKGVRKQWQLNGDASDEYNKRVIKYAGTIARAYSDISFDELITEANKMSKSLGTTDEEALGIVNDLLRIGFPEDQLDIIGEYGDQLKRAGYSAEEIQAIFKAGVKTDTWNIDNLLDGLKEGRIKMAEFGQGIDDTMSGLLDQVGISSEQFQIWGQAIAKGGEEGKQAYQEVAKALAGVEDETLRNQLGVAVFGKKSSCRIKIGQKRRRLS